MSKKAVSLRFAAILFAGFALAACATTGGAPNEGDPLEPTNRALFDVTMAIDRNLTRPVAIVYRDGLPQGARAGIRNFLDNLSSPRVLANDILQGEPDRAGTTLARAVVNTTVGIGGIFEVAEDWGLPKHREDFGQTLAVWGIGEGPYLVVPFLGPSNSRDLVGFGVDFLMHPFTHVRWAKKFYTPWTRLAVDGTDRRSRVIDQVDDVERTSADFYAATRSIYRQSRIDAINNGVIAVDELPDF